MEQSQPQVTVSMQPPPVLAQLAVLLIMLGAVAGLVLAMMPAQDRQLLIAALRQQRFRLYRGLSERARRAGYEGMTSEIEGQNPGIWYERARGLAWWRDRVKP